MQLHTADWCRKLHQGWQVCGASYHEYLRADPRLVAKVVGCMLKRMNGIVVDSADPPSPFCAAHLLYIRVLLRYSTRSLQFSVLGYSWRRCKECGWNLRKWAFNETS